MLLSDGGLLLKAFQLLSFSDCEQQLRHVRRCSRGLPVTVTLLVVFCIMSRCDKLYYYLFKTMLPHLFHV